MWKLSQDSLQLDIVHVVKETILLEMSFHTKKFLILPIVRMLVWKKIALLWFILKIE